MVHSLQLYQIHTFLGSCSVFKEQTNNTFSLLELKEDIINQPKKYLRTHTQQRICQHISSQNGGFTAEQSATNRKGKTSISIERKVELQIVDYQCNGLLPSLSGTSGSAFHFETMW